jgi:cytochrome oxidase Cu insertion factor (SCO1/SenC/PrrC family)/thiol-disulfide isomerase/thioredoxin
MDRMRRFGALLAALTFAACLIAGPGAVRARADGDPGSDVLVSQSLFYQADAGVSVGQEEQLDGALQSAQKAGFPLRVAIIARKDDLGSITGVWLDPVGYAAFLGYELKDSYTGRLLVVMPNGFALYWGGHPAAQLAGQRALAKVRVHAGEGFAPATLAAIDRLAAAGGVRLGGAGASSGAAGTAGAGAGATGTSGAGGAGAASTAGPVVLSGGSGGNSAGEIIAIMCALLVIVGAVRYAIKRGLLLARGPADGAPLPPRSRAAWAMPGIALLAGVVAIGVLVSDLPSSSSSTADGTLANNPYLDPGTQLGTKPAPDFTLYDQFGRRVSLRQYRGKVVILAFVDSECTTVCPLTTTAMLGAKRLLGRAGSQVQLLGVDANPKDIQIQDVLSYSQLHGLTHAWRFGTGTLSQLQGVWNAYGLRPEIQGGLISHTAALFMIDPQGRERTIYITKQSYTAVDQQAQLLAQEASRLLPDHPRVASHISYGAAKTVGPAVNAKIPRAGGGSVRLGPGEPHLYVFFDTWDQEIMSLGGELDALNSYATGAAKAGLPNLVGIDEGSVEPSTAALPDFLRGLGRPLTYPVGIDSTGRIADGYEVQGAPYMVLTSASGKILWYYEPDTAGSWLTEGQLVDQVRGALKQGLAPPATLAAAQRELAGSPAPLAALHKRANQIVGSEPALAKQIRALRGYPIVLNLWASWCTACQKEFNLFASASAHFGRSVAFLGGDYNDSAGAAAAFLHQHAVSYPSYELTPAQAAKILPGGVEGLPTTDYISSTGKITSIRLDNYPSQGALNDDVASYALGR